MRTLSTGILLFAFSFCGAQVLDEYPKGQDFYKGGLVNFYREAHELFAANKTSACGENEIYVVRILVTKDSAVKVVADNDKENIAKNKCAYDASMQMISNLKNWQPAVVHGRNFGAVADFLVYPNDLINNYFAGYLPSQYIKPVDYKGGYTAFWKDFKGNSMALFDNYHINGKMNIEFYVNAQGNISEERIYPDVDNRNFKTDLFRALRRVKNNWTPATYRGISFRSRISLPLNFGIDFNGTHEEHF